MSTMPIYALVDTWNSAGTTFTGIGLNVTDTASAAGSLLLDLQVGEASKFSVDKTGTVTLANRVVASTVVSPSLSVNAFIGNSNIFNTTTLRLNPTVTFAWSATANSTTTDLILVRDDAGTLAQRNGTNAQVFRLYNTFTDASNYERFAAYWSSNTLRLLQENAGTGSARTMVIGTAGASAVYVQTNNNNRWFFESGGNFLAAADNTYDIGASGATRPRNVFVAGLVNLGGNARIASAGAGILLMENNTGTDFSRLQFGGTTSSFPALKRSSTTLQARLADDTDFGSIQGKLTTETAYTAGAPTATGYLVLYDSNGTAYKVPAEAV